MKNETNHTAGPWIVTDSGQIKSEAIVRLGFSDYVCQMPYASKAEAAEMPRSVNDARLIAAAPDLLAALKSCCRLLHFTGHEEGWQYMAGVAAIAKAEGK